MANIDVTTNNTTVELGDNDTVKIKIPGAGGTVTVTADPNDNVDKITIEFLDDSQADTAIVDLSSFSENGLQIDIKKYDPSDTLDLQGAFNRRVDPNDDSKFLFDYIGSDGGTYSGYANAKDGGEKNFTTDPAPIIICFAKGTMIETTRGPCLVESLAPGDLVCTQDNGPQPVRWIGSRHLDSLDLTRHPQLRPIQVSAGALGHHVPMVNLVLSPQHRVQIEGWRPQLWFGEDRVLVPICHLVNDDTITVLDDASGVTYYHILFERHEIVMSNGLPSESLYPGPMAVRSIEPAVAEILQLFPDLDDIAHPAAQPAGRFLRRHEASVLQVSAG